MAKILHVTAAKVQEENNQKIMAAQQLQAQQLAQQQQYDLANAAYMEDNTPEEMSVMSENIMDEDIYGVPPYTNSRKRKREEHELTINDIEHQQWADALLDYFMLADSADSFPAPPNPPPNISLDSPIDDRGHTALHWASAMGDLDVVRNLVDAGARTDRDSKNLETPLMRSVMFTNNFDKQTMPKLFRILAASVHKADWFGSTVFHHIAATTSSKSKYIPARYYMETIINVLAETWIPDEITKLLNRQDQNGDTAMHIAARNGARKLVRSLLARNVSTDLRNANGEVPDEMILELNARRELRSGGPTRRGRDVSSSPFGPNRACIDGELSGMAPKSHSPSMYRSDTANELQHKIGPTIMAKVRSLALAYEAEYEEKESEANENESVVKKRRVELDELRSQVLEQERLLDEEQARLAAKGESREQEEMREEAELEALEREAISLLELEQQDSLTRAMHQPGRHAQTSMGPPLTNGSSDPMAQHSLANRVRQAQLERQKLTSEIVRSMATAGLGEKHNEYKRLIHGALGVPENEMESMLDEIIGQLEEDRRERMIV